MARLVPYAVSALVLLTLGYLLVAGAILARTAKGVLTVGTLTAAWHQDTTPTDPLAIGYRGTPDTAFGMAFQTVVLDTPLGPAKAWLVPAKGVETGRAIYVHGIAGAREDGYRHLSMLHDAGFTVLLVTYRNDADAPAAPEGLYGFGLTEWPDLEAGVRHMVAKSAEPDAGLPLLIVAESMGGAILGQFLLNSDLADRVDAIALDSPALSLSAVLSHLAGQSGRPLPNAFARVAGTILPWTTGLPLDRAETVQAFQQFPGPLFLAHGSGDRIVPIGPSQALAATRSGPTTTFWTTADHLGSFTLDPVGYRAAFDTLLAAVLTTPSSP